MKVKVADVKVGNERFRNEYGEIEELAVSIQRYGLLHPIVVDDELNLIAGERRLKAHRLLGITEIEVKQLSSMNDLEKREIEIEENLKRKDFTWQEEVRAKNEINKIKRELYGAAIKGHGGGWSIKDTADSTGESIGTISRDLRLAQAIDDYPELMKETSKDAAWKKLQKMRERQVVDALADKVKIEINSDCIVCGNNEVEMRKLPSNSVDLVFTDPQYGINFDKNSKVLDAWANKVYKQDDEEERVMNNISIVVRECYRVLKNDRHMYLWFGIQHYSYLLRMIQEAGFNVNPVPCVWYKTGGGGACGSEYTYASNYETCLFCMKGRRPLNKLGQTNVWMEPRVAPQRKVHPAEKPRTLIRKMIEQSSNPGELVIDPYGGSFSTLISALEIKRNGWSCDIDKECCSQGILRLEMLKKGTPTLSEVDSGEGEEV